MNKFRLLALSAVVSAMAGCASTEPTPGSVTIEEVSNSFGRDTIHVTRMAHPPTAHCIAGWETAETFKPTGIIDREGLRFTVKHTNHQGKGSFAYNFDVPYAVGDKVQIVDFQKLVELQVMPEQNGPVTIGDYYSYLDGFSYRLSRPRVIGNEASVCIAIERMYAVGQEVPGEGTIPSMFVDRAVFEHRAKLDEEVAFTLEGNQPAELQITVRAIR